MSESKVTSISLPYSVSAANFPIFHRNTSSVSTMESHLMCMDLVQSSYGFVSSSQLAHLCRPCWANWMVFRWEYTWMHLAYMCSDTWPNSQLTLRFNYMALVWKSRIYGRFTRIVWGKWRNIKLRQDHRCYYECNERNICFNFRVVRT